MMLPSGGSWPGICLPIRVRRPVLICDKAPSDTTPMGKCRRKTSSILLPGLTLSMPGSAATSEITISLHMNNISVIGAGTMGNGIAHVFAQKGFTVNLIDTSAPQLEKALKTIGANLDRQIAKGVLTEEDKKGTLGRIQSFGSIPDGVAGADLVVEAAT